MNHMKEEFKFVSAEGVNHIHAVLWTPDVTRFPNPRGVIQISHGMVEYIDRYEEFAGFFNDRGFVVAGNDHLGHGKSVKSQEDWGYFSVKDGSRNVVEDLFRLTGILNERFKGIPLFLLGHSMGSFMARRYIMNYGNGLAGVVILGTGNQSKSLIYAGFAATQFLTVLKGERHRSSFMDNLMFGKYNHRIENPKSAHDWISSDEKIVEQYDKTPECTFLFTLNGIKNLLKTLLYIENNKNISRIPKKLPILIASGKEDPVGDYGKAVECVYQIYKGEGIDDITLKLYDGCRHELQNETIRPEIYEFICTWVENRIQMIISV